MTDEKEDLWFNGETTLRKVYAGLLDVGIYGQLAVEVVDSIEAQGIFFREKKPKRRGRPPKDQTKSPTPSIIEPEGTAGNSGASYDAWAMGGTEVTSSPLVEAMKGD